MVTKRIIGTLLTLATGIFGILITDPAKAQAVTAQEAAPKADSVAAQPAAAPIVKAAEVQTYQPADLAKYVTAAFTPTQVGWDHAKLL
jgi:hypothetical protein